MYFTLDVIFSLNSVYLISSIFYFIVSGEVSCKFLASVAVIPKE